MTSILIPTRFPRLFFQVSEAISAFCRSGLVLPFPTPCRIWGRDGVVPSLDEVFKVTGNSGAIGWPGMSRATEATTQHQLERSRKGSCWASNHANEAHMHLIWWPSRAVLGWMGAHPCGALTSNRSLHAETSHAAHCGLRRRSLLPIIGTPDGRKPLTTTDHRKIDAPYTHKREEKAIQPTIHYQLLTINY